MGRARITFAGNDFGPLASSIALSSYNSTYPPTYLQDYDPATPSKANSTTATWTFYLSSAVTPVLFAAFNYNWNAATSVSFGNSMGFVTAITNNPRTLGGFCDDTWKELTGSNRTSSIFFLTVTAANTIPAVGHVAICNSFSYLPVQWGDGNGPDFGLDYLDTEVGRTFYGTLLLYPKGVRPRSFSGDAFKDSSRSILQLAAESAQGRRYPFVLVPDDDTTSAQWVRFGSTQFRFKRTGVNASRTTFSVEELAPGPPL